MATSEEGVPSQAANANPQAARINTARIGRTQRSGRRPKAGKKAGHKGKKAALMARIIARIAQRIVKFFLRLWREPAGSNQVPLARQL